MDNKQKTIISSISTKIGKTAPILATFLNGEVSSNSENNFKCDVKRDSNNVIEKMNITANDMTYTNIENKPTNDLRSFIAVRNKITNKMRIYEFDEVILKPYIKEKEISKISEVNTENRRSKKLELNKTFGSRKSRILIERMEKMKTNIDRQQNSLEKLATSRTISDMEVNFFQDQDSSEHYMDCLPPCNRVATSAEEVYFLNDIISEEDLNTLKETAEKINKNRNNLEEYDFSSFFVSCLNALPSGNDKIKKICLLLYAEALLKIANVKSKIFSHKFNPCPFSPEISKKIIMDFTNLSLNENHLPKHLQDKALCYLLIILFLIFNFKIDLGWLMTSYSGGLKRLKELMLIVGGSTKSKLNNIYQLCVPLPSLPKLLTKKSKKF